MESAGAGVLTRWQTPDGADVALARHMSRLFLGRFGFDGVQGDCSDLVVSELMTNALRHGAAPVELRVWPCPLQCVVVEVRDGKAGGLALPAAVAPGEIDPLAETGRGLAMVTTLTRGFCGVVALPGPGKSVWAALSMTGHLVCPRTLAAFVDSRVRAEEPGPPR